MDPWLTHHWRQRVVTVGAVEKKEHFCVRCERRLVEVEGAGVYVAAFPGLLDFEELAPDVTVLWLTETCPGRPLKGDREARVNRPRWRKMA